MSMDFTFYKLCIAIIIGLSPNVVFMRRKLKDEVGHMFPEDIHHQQIPYYSNDCSLEKKILMRFHVFQFKKRIRV